MRIAFSAPHAIIALVVCSNVYAETTLRQWEVFEFSLTAERSMENPYVEGLRDDGDGYLKVMFDGTSGGALGKRYSVTGFWDGGQTWKVRFTPSMPGVCPCRHGTPGASQRPGAALSPRAHLVAVDPLGVDDAVGSSCGVVRAMGIRLRVRRLCHGPGEPPACRSGERCLKGLCAGRLRSRAVSALRADASPFSGKRFPGESSGADMVSRYRGQGGGKSRSQIQPRGPGFDLSSGWYPNRRSLEENPREGSHRHGA